MPRKYKKRTYKKKKKWVRKRKRIPLPLGGFTDTKIVRLRWVKAIKIDAGANSFAIAEFNANGPYRVQTSDTHQPANFDVWMRRYSKYTVLGSKITATFTPDAAAQIIPGYVGIYLTQVNTELATLLTNGVANAMEQKNTVKMAPLAALQSTTRSLTKGFSPSKLFGVPKIGNQIDDKFIGDVTKNPAALGYFQLFVASIDGNNPGEMDFLVTVDFTLKLSGLLQQSPS